MKSGIKRFLTRSLSYLVIFSIFFSYFTGFGFNSTIKTKAAEDFTQRQYQWTTSKFQVYQTGTDEKLKQSYIKNTVQYKIGTETHTQEFIGQKFTTAEHLTYETDSSSYMMAPSPTLPQTEKRTNADLYIINSHFKEDGKDVTFAPGNRANYYFWVNPIVDENDQIKSYRVEKIMFFSETDNVLKNDREIFEINGQRRFFSIATGGDLGPFGWYVMSSNTKGGLPKSIGAGANIWGSLNDKDKKTAQTTCKKYLIEAVSQDGNWEELDELAKPLKYDASPFHDEAKDKELYQKYYSTLKWGDAGFYSNVHADYVDFLNQWQGANDDFEYAQYIIRSPGYSNTIWNLDLQNENWVSRFVNKWTGNPVEGDGEVGDAGFGGNPVGVTAATLTGAKFTASAVAKGAEITRNLSANPAPKVAAFWKNIFSGSKLAANASPESISQAIWRAYSVEALGVDAATIGNGTAAGVGTSEAAATGAGIGVGTIAAIGVIAVGISIVGVATWKNHLKTESMDSRFQLFTMQQYISHHVDFHRCMVDNGATSAGFTKAQLEVEEGQLKTINKLDSGLFNAALEITDHGNDTCPSSSWLQPTTWFKSSLCGMGMALHEAGMMLVKFAERQLWAVLGMRYKTSNGGY